MREARFGSLLLAIVACGLWSAAPVDASEVRTLVEDTLEEALAILGDTSLSEAERRSRIEDVAFEQFDFDVMARLVLGRNWKKFSAEQKVEFVSQFKILLSNSYGTRLDRFSKQTIEVTGEQDEPRGDVTVKTRIVGGEFDSAQIDYRMRERDGRWRAIDVVIEGISLVSNYRSQFGDIVAKRGSASFLEQLREKNAKTATSGESS